MSESGPQYAYPPEPSGPSAPGPPGPPAPPGGYPPGPYPPRPIPPSGYQAGSYPPSGYPGGPYPPSGYPPGYPGGPYPAARGPGLPRPVAVESVPGTPFGVAVVEVAPSTSGPASGSLVIGIVSIAVAFVVGCFAQVGADDGWGTPVAGAFAVLAALTAVGAIWLYGTALTRIRRSVGWGATKGRGMAIAGLVCGLVGLALAGIIMVVAIAR